MLRYTLVRFAQALLVLWVVATVVFLLSRASGNVAGNCLRPTRGVVAWTMAKRPSAVPAPESAAPHSLPCMARCVRPTFVGKGIGRRSTRRDCRIGR